MSKIEAKCGLCDIRAHETDRLVQLGSMGYICLCCLEQVAHNALPDSFAVSGPPARRVESLPPQTSASVAALPLRGRID